MGAFFTSVHVRTTSQELVIDALRKDAAGQGLDEIEDGVDADRVVFVTEPDAGGWIAVYDLESEAQDVGVLERLAACLSDAARDHALTILVHDGDTLDVRLFAQARRVDRYEAGVRHRPGAVERWAPLTEDSSALDRLFVDAALVAEAALVELARAVGIEPERATAGHRHLAQEAEGPARRMLRFGRRGRTASGTGQRPAFEPHGRPLDFVSLGTGDTLRMGASFASVRGAGTGVSILVRGEALERGLVALDALQVRGVGGPNQTMVPSPGESGGRPCWSVELPRQAIPAGLLPRRGMEVFTKARQDLDAQRARLIHVKLVGRVVQAGEGSLEILIAPREHHEGTATVSTTLNVVPASRRPLRARSLEGHLAPRQSLLSVLEGSSHAQLLVSVDSSRRDVAGLATALAFDLSTLLPPERVEISILPSRVDAQVRTRCGSDALLRGKRLAALRETMSEAPSVSIDARCELRGGPGFRDGPGWQIAAGLSMTPERLDERVGTVVVAVERASCPPDVRREIRARLEQALDDAIALGALSGSIVTMGPPSMVGVIEQCDYERACGVGGPALTTRAWCARWVRAPGMITWLGPTLVAHLERSVVDAVAAVEERDGGWLLRTSAWSNDAFEEALAPVLPSAADAADATREFYAGA